jgi:hypothetical protein
MQYHRYPDEKEQKYYLYGQLDQRQDFLSLDNITTKIYL